MTTATTNEDWIQEIANLGKGSNLLGSAKNSYSEMKVSETNNYEMSMQTNQLLPDGSQQSFQASNVQIPGISQLLPSLYLCGASVISDKALEDLAISFVINIAPELPDTPLPHSNSDRHVLYLRINAFDLPNSNLSVHFDEVTDMIETVRQSGGRTLVHCVAGVSRSTTFCLAYLIKYAGMNLREAFFHTKAIRPQIRPNLGFFQQLRAYEQHLHGAVSVNMVYYECTQCKIPDVYETEYRAMEDFYQKQRKFKRLHKY